MMKERPWFEASVRDGVALTVGFWCPGLLNVCDSAVWDIAVMLAGRFRYESDYRVLHEASEDTMVSKLVGGISNLNMRP